MIGIRIHRTADGRDHTDFIDDAAILFSLQDDMILPALCRQPVRPAAGDLFDHDRYLHGTTMFPMFRIISGSSVLLSLMISSLPSGPYIISM